MNKVQKILSEIATRKLCTMDEHMAFYNDKAKEDYRFLSEIEEFINASQEEPVSEDFKEFEVEYIEREKDNIVCIYDRHAGLVDGAKWQKEQMTSKAIDAKVEADLDPHGADYGIQRLECEYGQLEALKIKNESKVKVIVIKEDGI